MSTLKKIQILSHSFQAYLESGCVAPANQGKEGWVCFSMDQFISGLYSIACDLKTNRFSDKQKPIKKNKYFRKCVHSTPLGRRLHSTGLCPRQPTYIRSRTNFPMKESIDLAERESRIEFGGGGGGWELIMHD